MARYASVMKLISAFIAHPWVKRIGWLTLIASLALNIILGIPLLRKSQTMTPTNTTTVTNVVDGDTFDTKDGTRVRLIGIDAPEYPQGCLSKRAKERLHELLLGKEVELEVTGEDRFGRKTAWVTRDDRVLINEALVSEGFASVDATDDARGGTLIKAENDAKATKRGIWSSECTSAREGCTIKGNYHKGTKERTYHLPGCYNYNQISINPNESDRWFCTEKEAEAAGFVKSRDCPGEK